MQAQPACWCLWRGWAAGPCRASVAVVVWAVCFYLFIYLFILFYFILFYFIKLLVFFSFRVLSVILNCLYLI